MQHSVHVMSDMTLDQPFKKKCAIQTGINIYCKLTWDHITEKNLPLCNDQGTF